MKQGKFQNVMFSFLCNKATLGNRKGIDTLYLFKVCSNGHKGFRPARNLFSEAGWTALCLRACSALAEDGAHFPATMSGSSEPSVIPAVVDERSSLASVATCTTLHISTCRHTYT